MDLGHDVLVVQLADVLWPMLRQVVAHAGIGGCECPVEQVVRGVGVHRES
ncbi:hypothetical protein ACFQ1S_17140 [Kibdelosporangium lantanae]|uniref:Uncharacterized protein n=1 Tax=Kibdelosporangium lantanae TaxID=1497396 RepID=A0ABW3M8W4_9PSEU